MKHKAQEEAIGVRLKNYRLDKGLTQEKLAVLLSLSRVTITNIEGGRVPTDLNRVKIEKFLNREQAA